MDSLFAEEIERMLGTCISAIDELQSKGHSLDEAVLEVLGQFEDTMLDHGVTPDQSQMMLLDLSTELRRHYKVNKPELDS